MPLVKDASYRDIPYSSETPEEPFHLFLSLKELRVKITKHQRHLYRCRTVGVMFCLGQAFTLHELDDRSSELRVSLMYLKGQMPFTGLPFTAQVFGYAHWKQGIGPVLYASDVRIISPSLARSIHSTMQWVIKSHLALNPDAAAREIKKDEYHLRPN